MTRQTLYAAPSDAVQRVPGQPHRALDRGVASASCTSSSWAAAGSAPPSPAPSSGRGTRSPSSTRTSPPSAGSAPSFEGRTVTGVGFDRDTLRAAGIDHAYAFAAVSSGDNSNILAARVAREKYGVENVVARIYDPGRAEIYQRLGIPTVATVKWTSDQMLRRLLPQGHVPEFTDPSGKVVIAEMPVSAGWVGRRHHRDRGRHRWAARLPHPARRRASCPGLTPSTRRATCSTSRCCARTSRPPSASSTPPPRRTDPKGSTMRVVIAGAGSVGRSIARELLRNGHHVLLVDREADGERVQKVPDASWLQADACEIEALERGGARRVRRRRRRDRRRQGQPRAVAAGQDGVRRPAHGRPGQQPEERVDVRRGVGRGRRGVDAAAHDRPRRGGRERRRPRAHLRVPAGQGDDGRDDPAGGEPVCRCAGR